MKNSMILLAFSFIFFGCSTADDQTTTAENDNNVNPYPINIDFVSIGQGELYGNGEEGIPEQNMLIENNADWHQLLAQMNTVNNISDDFVQTNIDFSQYIIIAVFDQIRMYGGYSIDILEITENQNEIVVDVGQLHPGGGYAVITQPYHIVKIPVVEKPIVFQ